MPIPKPGESQRHFVARCVIDNEARTDFPDANQRIAFCYSQYENKDENFLDTKTFKISKKFGDAWRNANEKQRLITERRNTKRFTKFYQKQYNLAVDNKLTYNDIKYENLFKYNDLRKLYDELYLDTSMHFAKWYARTFDLYITKGINPKQFLNQWQLAIIGYAQTNTALNITGVANTGRKTAIKLIQRMFADPDFMILGAEAKARILRKQFRKYSKYQAMRVVRTESTRAANFGIEQSAQSVFAGKDLIKRWSAAIDGREREWHNRANNQEVPQKEYFVVGGEYIKRPGEGSARNVINCRCSAVYLPVKDAQTINELEGMNFGLAGSTVMDSIAVTNVMRDINRISSTVAAETVATELTQKELMRPSNWDDFVKGKKINDDYLELLKTQVSLTKVTGGSSQRGLTIRINSKRYKNNIEDILAHEIGHAIHTQRGWLTQYSANPLIEKLYLKHREFFGMNLRGAKRIAHQKKFRNRFGSINGKFRSKEAYDKYIKAKNKTRKKFPNMSDAEFNEKYLAMADYIGAITKNNIAFGHSTAYYKTSKWQMFEMFAHIMENKYATNNVFKLLYPKLYKQGIDMLDELIKLNP